MNIDKLSSAINKFSMLIKYADNIFILGFDDDIKIAIENSANDFIYSLNDYLPVISSITQRKIHDKTYESILFNNITNKLGVMIDDLSNIAHLFGLSKLYSNMQIISDILNKIRPIDFDPELHTNYVVDKYSIQAINNIKQVNLLNKVTNLTNIILNEEENPVIAWKEFINAIVEILNNFSTIIDQVSKSDINSYFIKCISDLESESEKNIKKWTEIFDQIEYENIINTSDPEDMEY